MAMTKAQKPWEWISRDNGLCWPQRNLDAGAGGCLGCCDKGLRAVRPQKRARRRRPPGTHKGKPGRAVHDSPASRAENSQHPFSSNFNKFQSLSVQLLPECQRNEFNNVLIAKTGAFLPLISDVLLLPCSLERDPVSLEGQRLRSFKVREGWKAGCCFGGVLPVSF